MTITFTAYSLANTTQDIVITYSFFIILNYIIDNNSEKRRKGVYGPSLGRVIIIHIEDLNMPMIEEYGAQPPIELLRYLMDKIFIYL